MKETVKTSRTAGYLEKIFRALNADWFGGELEEPIITIQSTPRAYGHVTVAKTWKRKDDWRHELNLGAETLDRPIEHVVATIVHEMVHLYNIAHEGLVWEHPCDSDIFDGYVELMTESACSSRETVRICGQDLPVSAVRSRFLKLGREHVLYVRDCLCNVTAKIGNTKAYTLAALYNAPVTMEQYYAALVSRDMTKNMYLQA